MTITKLRQRIGSYLSRLGHSENLQLIKRVGWAIIPNAYA